MEIKMKTKIAKAVYKTQTGVVTEIAFFQYEEKEGHRGGYSDCQTGYFGVLPQTRFGRLENLVIEEVESYHREHLLELARNL